MAAVDATDWAMDGTVIWAKRAEGRVARAGTSPATNGTGSASLTTAAGTATLLAAALREDFTLTGGVAMGAFAIALAGFKTSFGSGNGGVLTADFAAVLTGVFFGVALTASGAASLTAGLLLLAETATVFVLTGVLTGVFAGVFAGVFGGVFGVLGHSHFTASAIPLGWRRPSW